MLDRFLPIFTDSEFPHLCQTAYQRNISCRDAIFATQEAILKIIKDGGEAFLSLHDLEKAFDTIEVPILLENLFKAGINGKGWRMIKAWYENPTCREWKLMVFSGLPTLEHLK